MIAFVMNAVAWEPVIKETHWFGMHEYYDNNPLVGITQSLNDTYLRFSAFNDRDWDNKTFEDFWHVDINQGNTTYSAGHGNIGSYNVNPNANVSPAPSDGTHLTSDYCIGVQVRWSNNYIAYTQETNRKLPAGHYKLSYDVLNANNNTANKGYISRFYVQAGSNTFTDNNTDWKNTKNTWLPHIIEFDLSEASKVTISLGYGNPWDGGDQVDMPALYVSHLKLEAVNDDTYTTDCESRIDWEGNYIRSITVVRDWTGHDPLQRPKTSFYSWLDHKLRFSVNNKSCWTINRNGKHDNVLGLMNSSNGYDSFWIHDLKEGDQFNIEYYRYPDQDASPFLVSGSVKDRTAEYNYSGNSAIYGADENQNLVYYTMTADGDVQVNMPGGVVIRSITIIHKQSEDRYKKATYEVTPISPQGQSDGEAIGYRYTLTGSGVLEDKRGAVPYITMRFGDENDMTFVKDLGNGEFGAASIIDDTDEFDPMKGRHLSEYRGFTEAQLKDRFARKEWTVFSADLNGNGGNIFETILPLYGSFLYFFPEVDGKLSIRFYCEGAEEHMPLWYKYKNGNLVDQLKEGPNSNGGNFYEYKDLSVGKGDVYYLCSNPTIVTQEHPIIRLISYEFIPTFRVNPLYDVVETAKQSFHNAATIEGVTISEFTGVNSSGVLSNSKKITINGEETPMIKFLGNVESATVSLRQSGDDVKLDFDDITYKNIANVNQGGAIVVNLDCPAGRAAFVLTVAYDAANKNPNGTAVSTLVKKWDFYSGVGDGTDGLWNLGKYGVVAESDKTLYETNPTAWKAKSKLFKEINKADGLTADWVDTYVNLTDGKNERIFKSVYDMEGDNADMIHETAGLIFLTNANQLGIMNENDAPTNSFQDRYIGLMKGSKFTIPLLDAGDRIVLKMGTYNNEQVTLGMTNAKDVSSEGKTIGNNYIIGGSVPVEGDVKDADNHVVPRGEYHIQAIADGDVDIEVVDGQLLKLYTIEIYRNAKNNNTDIITENELIGSEDLRQILNTSEYHDPDNITLHPQYRGLNEHTNYAVAEAKTGNLQNSDIVKSGNPNSLWYTFQIYPLPTPENPKFGVFKARQGVQTIGEKYVTDYADCMVPVGYRETKSYPYTWDFTNLKKYISASIAENGVEKEVADTDADLRIWNNWNLRVKPDEWDGNIFASGGQLYGGKAMFEETRGIGITHNNNGMKLNGTGYNNNAEEDGGLEVGDEYGFTIPQLAKNYAVYVRAKALIDDPSANYEFSDGTSTYVYGNNPESFSYSETAADGSGDVVFAVAMPSNLADDEKIDVMLSFQGYEVKKIAVSTAPKTLSAKGWTSESRDYVIDPSLTSYMTGKKFRTFVVSGVDYENRVVTLTRIDNAGEGCLMPAAAADGDKNACLILNVNGTADSGIEGSPEGVFGTQFHLFVPDMHDYGTKTGVTYLKTLYDTSGSKLKAQLYPGNVNAVDGDYTNFAFTCMYYDLDPETGQPLSTTKKVGPQAFYRIAGGKTGTASSKGNQGYLPILTKEVGYPKETGGTSGAGARFTLVIIDDNEATGIATVERIVQDGRFYNLNGQQLDGTPNRSGLYIVNGKKVYIKNK